MKVSIGKYPGPRSKKERRVKIQIDPWDTWNMDDTLAMIILPMLKQLKETNHGAPFVEDELVPEHLRSTSAPPKENEWDTDENHFKRWDWVMDEMIWAFEQLVDGSWEDQYFTGETDIVWEEINPPLENEAIESLGIQANEPLYEMKAGPKDTSRFDKEGWDMHNSRINRGCMLFGQFFRALWD